MGVLHDFVDAFFFLSMDVVIEREKMQSFSREPRPNPDV